MFTVNPLLSPPGGLFQARLKGGGGLDREGGGGLFNIAKRIIRSLSNNSSQKQELAGHFLYLVKVAA